MPNQVNVTDVTIKKLDIHSATGLYDLKPHFMELNIYENIFRPALTATLVLADSHNIPYKLPIVGEETIDIDIALTGVEGVKDEEALSIIPPRLHVNSLSDRYFTKPKAQVFSLDLISEQYMSSLHSKVSKSYRGKSISFIVDDIHWKYLNDGERGMSQLPDDRIENIVIPNLSPIDAIKWLSKRASRDGAVNYLFWEDLNQSYFYTLEYLAEQKPVATFIHKPRIDDPTGVGYLANDTFRIDKFYFKKQFNKKENIERGVYSSKLITHDIVRKKITQHEYTGFNDWFAYNHCGAFPPLSNSDIESNSAGRARVSHAPADKGNAYPTTDDKNLARQIDSHVEFFPKHDRMYAITSNDLYDNKVEDWKLKRNAHIGIYNGISLILEVSGHSGLRVGHTVTVILPSPETLTEDKNSDIVDDKFLSGKYMVTGIRHIFSQPTITDPKATYTMKVEVTKDGLEDVVPFRKPRERD
tara:strand:+ start:144 stop:1556 length:1413 start_codon:yes stop_codon:yes gene_type:complete